MDIFIFSTNVESAEEVNLVNDLLSAIHSIKTWNFDLEDCDKILRVESEHISPRAIEKLLQTSGFACCELEY